MMKFVKTLDLTEEEKEKLFHLNAEKQKPLSLWRGVGGEASLEIERPMSHAAGCAQRCAQCGEETYQNLNHHFPF